MYLIFYCWNILTAFYPQRARAVRIRNNLEFKFEIIILCVFLIIRENRRSLMWKHLNGYIGTIMDPSKWSRWNSLDFLSLIKNHQIINSLLTNSIPSKSGQLKGPFFCKSLQHLHMYINHKEYFFSHDHFFFLKPTEKIVNQEKHKDLKNKQKKIYKSFFFK